MGRSMGSSSAAVVDSEGAAVSNSPAEEADALTTTGDESGVELVGGAAAGEEMEGGEPAGAIETIAQEVVDSALEAAQVAAAAEAGPEAA